MFYKCVSRVLIRKCPLRFLSNKQRNGHRTYVISDLYLPWSASQLFKGLSLAEQIARLEEAAPTDHEADEEVSEEEESEEEESEEDVSEEEVGEEEESEEEESEEEEGEENEEVRVRTEDVSLTLKKKREEDLEKGQAVKRQVVCLPCLRDSVCAG